MSEHTPTRITSITIEGFGPLRHFSQEIEGLTVVFGRNESGKSSIVDAVYAWFRSEARFRGKPVEVIRTGEGYEGEVDLQVSGDMDGIIRLVKEHPHLLNLFFVPEGEADLSGRTGWLEGVKERLTGIDLGKVEDEIRSEIGMTRTGREQKDRKNRIEELETTRSKLENFFQDLEEISRLQSELKAARDKQGALKKERDNLRTARKYVTYKRLSEAIRKRDQAKAKLQDFERYTEEDLQTWEELEEDAGELRGENRVGSNQLEDDERELTRQKEEFNQIKEKKEGVDRKLDRAHDMGLSRAAQSHSSMAESVSPRPVPLYMPLIALLIGLGLAALSVIGLARVVTGVVAAVFVLAAGLLYVVGTLRRKKSIEVERKAKWIVDSAARIGLAGNTTDEISRELEDLRAQSDEYKGTLTTLHSQISTKEEAIGKLRGDISKLEERLGKAETDISALRDRTGLPDISTMRERIKDKREYLRVVETARNTLRESLPDDRETEWKTMIEELQCEDPGIEYSERKLDAAESALTDIAKHISDLADDLGEKTTWRLKTLGLSDTADANTRLEEINDELRRLEDKWRAGKLALHGIEQLSGDVELSLRQALAPGDHTASHYFGLFTQGRYECVSATGEDGSLVARSRDGDSFPASALSRGTRDQLFLALRLAIIRRILGSPGFMIWDDAFLTADHGRKTSLVQAAVELSGSGWQILYLTVDRDTRDLFRQYSRAQVIELPEPSWSAPTEPETI